MTNVAPELGTQAAGDAPDDAPEIVRGGVQFIPRPSSWREGNLAPWSELPPARRRLTLDGIRDALAQSAVRSPPRISALEGTGVRASAVLAPLYEEDGHVH